MFAGLAIFKKKAKTRGAEAEDGAAAEETSSPEDDWTASHDGGAVLSLLSLPREIRFSA